MTTVGSGDCFLAGYVAARFEGASPRDCLAFGVACGAESTQHFGAGTLDRREVERLLGRVEVRELDVPAGVPERSQPGPRCPCRTRWRSLNGRPVRCPSIRSGSP